MAWIYYLLLLCLDVVGLIMAAWSLPGLWVMLGAAAIYAYLTHRQYLGNYSLITLLLLAVGAEIGEIFLGGAGAKAAGASRWGILGGIVGGVLGGIFFTIPFPIVGTIIGICLGSFVGAAALEFALGRSMGQSLRIGVGAFKGRLFGISGKITIGVIMFLLTLVIALPIHLRHPVAPTVPASTQPITR